MNTTFHAALLLWGIIYENACNPGGAFERLSNVSAQCHTFRSLNKSNSTLRSLPFVAMPLTTSLHRHHRRCPAKSSLAFYMYIYRRCQDLKALLKKNSIHIAHENRGWERCKFKGMVRGGQGRDGQVRKAICWQIGDGLEGEDGIRPRWAQRDPDEGTWG